MEPIEDFPRLDGNFDLEPDKDDQQNLVHNYPEKIEMKKSTSSIPKKPDRDRSPLEVLRDLLQDPVMMETIREDLQADLRQREQQLEEVSPACDCPSRDNGSFYTQLGHAATMEELRYFVRELRDLRCDL